MYLDDQIDLDTPVSEIASEIRIDNAWEPAHPVRVIHLLQHTAGFDDMHFNEMYVRSGPADLPMKDVLAINPNSRRVRWEPGTRFSYSNPGYAVAGHVLERVAGMPFEVFIKDSLLNPLSMATSSFVLAPSDTAALAKGYNLGSDRPVRRKSVAPRRQPPHLALELGRWVHLLLNWGETENDPVIDPEYLSNMEHPRTTVASFAGLRNGYGSGIPAARWKAFRCWPWRRHRRFSSLGIDLARLGL
jgi:CubicO group peptidase (beta-lactamase class C family)